MRTAPVPPPAHQSEQDLEIDGFDEVVVKPGFAGSLEVFVLSVTGDGDEECLPAVTLLSKPGSDLVSIHAREADVEENDLGAVHADRLDGLRPAVGDVDLVA